MARELTGAEIEGFAAKAGVKRIAVENFLGSLDPSMDQWQHEANLAMDASAYKWNTATQRAIRHGIKLAYKGR